jgi:hypothetical protein
MHAIASDLDAMLTDQPASQHFGQITELIGLRQRSF